MELLLRRIAKKSNYTIGKLYIDNIYFCDTLEDTDRGLKDSMSDELIRSVKIPGKTCIPTGKYKVTITYSPRFRRNLPLINNVKGFDGIRIHTGNTDKDTDGCILPGKNKQVGKVLDSKDTFNKLYNRLKDSKNITIEIL